MLLESVEYCNNLPFSVYFSNVAEENFHYHNEMEMLFILRGKTNCKIHNVLYTLTEGDLLIVDTKDMHRIYGSSEDVLMLVMYVDLEFYTDLYPDIDYMIFACEDYSKTSSLKYQDLQKKVSTLKHHIAKTALAYINDKDNVPLLMDCINDLIFTLVNQFQGFFIEDHKFKADHGGPEDIDLSRLYKIIKYIYLNYNEKITLEDLADIVYLNPYYISHLIKNTSGLSFQNFLNYVRLEYAEKLLVENQMTLTQISESCGFSSLSYFNKCFKTWYNMSPAQYRAQLKPCERRFHKSFSEEVAISLLKPHIITHHSQRSSELLSKSSHHIFIPVKHNYRMGKKFKSAFPLKIILTSESDIFMLHHHKERLKKLNPACIVLDYQIFNRKQNKKHAMNILSALQSLGFPLQITNAPEMLEGHEKNTNGVMDQDTENMIKALGIPFVYSKTPSVTGSPGLLPLDKGIKWVDESDEIIDTNTVCSALTRIIKKPKQGIRLIGPSVALFSQEGLLSPSYFAYAILSQISGIITEQRDQYMIVKNKKTIYVLIFNEDKNSKLKSHIHVKGIWGKSFIVEKTYTQEQNCYKALKSFSYPPFLTDSMKSHINDFSSGTVRLSSYDAKESLDINFDLEPGSFTLIEIGKH
ncbi:MAG: helix-turn-helix domain-containing protein [Anaerovoracaceae bacterium]